MHHHREAVEHGRARLAALRGAEGEIPERNARQHVQSNSHRGRVDIHRLARGHGGQLGMKDANVGIH